MSIISRTFFLRTDRRPGRASLTEARGCLAIALLLTAVLETRPSMAAEARNIPTSRPLRYQPQQNDFVIENGEHWFNRPLYGPHVAFHVDGGDKPEFALLNTTIKDGVLRLALGKGDQSKWLTDAANVTTRYRPGSLIYDIRDPLLGDAVLRLTTLSLPDGQGLILRAECTQGKTDAKLTFVYGGVIDLKGRRPGGRTVSSIRAIDENGGQDLRPDLELMPEQCKGNVVALKGATFQIRAGKEKINGAFSADGAWAVADGRQLATVKGLLASNGGDAPVVIGQAGLGTTVYMSVERELVGDGASTEESTAALLRRRFDVAEKHREQVAKTITVDTPDPFINAMPAALCVAADGCWQPPAWVHGAVSWRTPLLGWRGAYIGDALGWHDRAAAYFAHWAAKQNVADDFPTVATPDPKRNLAENDGKMLHSNGSIPAKHYDMNLVYIDALFRHLLWTGDKEMARKMWPVIQRHLAWEKRCFDRDGLYEGYACIWASDALQYNGGGAAHSTAYNEFQNRMAARIATWIGEDPAPYQAEADRIHQAMQKQLWLPDRGWYAEYKDVMGERQVHPAAALWSIYHSIDSQVPDPFQAWECLRYVDTEIAHIPVKGPGVPAGEYHVLPTTNWVPYEWSLNNVVTAENDHTALAYWQGGRPDEGFRLLKSTILDTMYLGMTPGNIPNLSAYDPYRGESYTDFADPIGMTSRALVEGLFGVRPNAIDSELLIRPGFPMGWDHASIVAPDFSYAFKLDGAVESWHVASKFKMPMRLRLQLPARGDRVESVLVNGTAAKWAMMKGSVGTPWIEVATNAPAATYDVVVRWGGEAVAHAVMPAIAAKGSRFDAAVGPSKLVEIADPQHILMDVRQQTDSMSAVAAGTIGNRTAFVKVQQGDLTWWLPLEMDIRQPLEIAPSRVQDAQHLRFSIQNNTATAINGTASIHCAGRELELPISISAVGQSEELVLPVEGVSPGTTHIRIDLGNHQFVEGDVLNWTIASHGAIEEPVDMSADFNDSVTHIFTNDYLSPRPTTCSLQMPLHGIGDWTGPTRTYAIDDSGIRKSASASGILMLPNGIPFRTPTAINTKNILFTSQWDNYPRQVSVPLTGRAIHAYFLLAGSTTPMEAELDNGELIVAYADGSTARLPLRNPTNWWPIDQNFRMDDYAFKRMSPVPLRVELKTGNAYCPTSDRMSPGGAATIVDMVLDPNKPLKSVTLHTKAYEIVMGMMGVTLTRP